VSITRGTRSTVHIRQGQAQNYRAALSVEPAHRTTAPAVEQALQQAVEQWQQPYPGVGLQRQDDAWLVTIPEVYRIGHEAHFGKVVEQYLRYLRTGQQPAWEIPNMLTKYYITTQALALTRR
jgi:hypothetical protein